jgi:hypothetical protein
MQHVQDSEISHCSHFNEHLFAGYLYLGGCEIPRDLYGYAFRIFFNVCVKNYIEKIEKSKYSCGKKLLELIEIIPHYMKANNKLMPNGKLLTHDLVDFTAREIAETITAILAQSIKNINRVDFEIRYEKYDYDAPIASSLIDDYQDTVNNINIYFELLLRSNIDKYFEKCLEIINEFESLHNYQGVQIVTFALSLVDDLMHPSMREKTPAWEPNKRSHVDPQRACLLNYNKYFISYVQKRALGIEADYIIKKFLLNKESAYRYDFTINKDILRILMGSTNLCYECVRKIKIIPKKTKKYHGDLMSKFDFDKLERREINNFFSEQNRLEIWDWLSNLGVGEGKCIIAFMAKLIE